ncbi:spore germination protein [Alkalihalobacillus sp. AL-G]|uniref:spore germination protein n=1 Tax=Alkalihalobacillus sp. AL-G TaxID=2926399 RepID=UPI00272A9BFD|nr:spore germination protein [Alkalihalobacillus sp. AL-G]WLD91592.1 spore germination protein [Alkalihalobacillus sp. AL-G]
MPAFVGAIKINDISGSAVVNIGDVFHIEPRSQTKTFAGAGSFNTGNYLRVKNGYSVTHTVDADNVDNSNIGNT